MAGFDLNDRVAVVTGVLRSPGCGNGALMERRARWRDG